MKGIVADYVAAGEIQKLFTTKDTAGTEKNILLLNAPAAWLTTETSASSVPSAVKCS